MSIWSSAGVRALRGFGAGLEIDVSLVRFGAGVGADSVRAFGRHWSKNPKMVCVPAH